MCSTYTVRTRKQPLLRLLTHPSICLCSTALRRMLVEHSREESEFIIAVVVIGWSLYLEVVEVFFVPSGSKSDTTMSCIVDALLHNFHMWHSCTGCAARCTMPGCVCIASGSGKLREASLRVGVVDQHGARCIPGRWWWGTSSD